MRQSGCTQEACVSSFSSCSVLGFIYCFIRLLRQIRSSVSIREGRRVRVFRNFLVSSFSAFLFSCLRCSKPIIVPPTSLSVYSTHNFRGIYSLGIIIPSSWTTNQERSLWLRGDRTEGYIYVLFSLVPLRAS